MYLYRRSYLNPEMNISDIIKENPSILLVLEHFGINDVLRDKDVSQLCAKYDIEVNLFLAICNLYNGFQVVNTANLQIHSIPSVLKFLNNSHTFYLNEKYPEITSYIRLLSTKGNQKEVKLIESFFNEYFNEVREHLNYEETIAFPYFYRILENINMLGNEGFSTSTYLHHHTDIETKLEDLKNLLLEYLQIIDKRDIKRKLLFSLFELESDLKIHSLIEEQILIPLALLLEEENR